MASPRTDVRDGEERIREEAALQAEEQRRAEAGSSAAAGSTATGTKTIQASTVKGNLWNSELNARLNGLDPESPYVTQRPNRNYFWYKVGEGEVSTALGTAPPYEADVRRDGAVIGLPLLGCPHWAAPLQLRCQLRCLATLTLACTPPLVLPRLD